MSAEHPIAQDENTEVTPQKLHTIREVSFKKRILAQVSICLLLLGILLGLGAFYNLKVRPDLARERAEKAAPRTEVVLYGTRTTLLSQPRDVAIGRDGLLFVADSGNGRIAVFDHLGTLQYVFGVEKELKGVRTKISKPSLVNPTSIAISEKGEIAVADTGRKELLVFDRNGDLIREQALRDVTISHVAYGPDEKNNEVLYAVTSKGIARTDTKGTFDIFVEFTKNASGSSAQVISGIAVTRSKKGDPVVLLTDASASTLISIDNFVAGRRIVGEMRGASIPNGVAAVTVEGADPTIWVSEAGKPSILEINSSGMQPTKSLSTFGTSDGALLGPAGIDANASRIAVADPLNNRVTVYRAIEDVSSIGTVISGQSWLLVISAALSLLGACIATILFLRTRIARYTFDASALERADLEGIIDNVEDRFEHYVPDVVVAKDIQEFAYRAVHSVPIDPRTVSEHLIEDVRLRYAYLDELDTASVALALLLKRTHTLVTDNLRIRGIARELHIRVLSYDDFIALTKDVDEISPQGQIHPSASALLSLLMLVATFALALALPGNAGAASSRTITELSDLKAGTPLLTSTSAPQDSAPPPEVTPNPDDLNKNQNLSLSSGHAILGTACASCHGSTSTPLANVATTQRASAIDRVSRLCATCHASSSLAAASQPFSATGGDISNFSPTQSGHRMGLSSEMPASKTQGIVALSCASCHSVHTAAEKTCSSCHSEAVFEQKEQSGLGIARTFDLTVETRAHGEQKDTALPGGHPSPIQTDRNARRGDLSSRAKAGVSVAQEGCYACHRGDLESDDSCKACHYSSEDFENDSGRKARATNWPHVDDSFVLLGTNSISKPSQNPSPELVRTEACTRCHPASKGSSRALSPHAVNHDATLSKPGTELKSPPAMSIETTRSPGYVATGRFAGSPLTMLVPETGDLITTYMDVKCTQCHNTNVQAEHALRTIKSCAVCHTAKDMKGRIDYTQVTEGMDAKSFATCGTANSACHSSDWHGFDSNRVKSAHSLRGLDSGDTLQVGSGCSQKEEGVPTCHARNSSESLFYFGSMDIASAHNDYWSAQNETHATHKDYAKTTVELTQTRGCGLCHNAYTEKPKGSTEVNKAKIGGSFTCATCHSIKREAYAQEFCLRATPKIKPIDPPAGATPLDVKALEYLRILGLQQNEPTAPQEEPAKENPSILKPGVSPSKRSLMPLDMTPVTQGIPLDSNLSIIGRMLSPYPSWMKAGQFVNTLINIK